jgi:hypothetical protein
VTSSGAPTGSSCTSGDTDIDLATGEVYSCTLSAWADTGDNITGPAGPNGNTILNGTGAPASSVGNPGDFYIDTAADVLYGPKSAATGWPAVGTALVGPAGAPGTGATVASLASGNSNCPNGGASVTDGNGSTAYACTGATGPAGPAGTTGQQATSVYGIGPLTVTPSSGFAVIPGMTQTVTVPANGAVLISTNGGAQVDSTASDGYSVVDVAVFIDGTLAQQGLYQRLVISNTAQWTGMFGYWSMQAAVPLSAGQHTITVDSAGYSSSGSDTALVGESDGYVTQPALTVTVLNT